MMTVEAYETLRKNYKDVYTQINMHPSDSTWLEDYLGFYPYETKKYTIEDFDLKDSEEYSEVALDNCITLYEHLKNLPRYIICNSRFWAWITFEKAYKQAIHSMKLTTAELIKTFWLTTDSRRSLMLGVTSRSYFRTEVSEDDSLDDRYKYTRRLVSGMGGLKMYRALVYRNIGMLKPVSLAFIQCFVDIESNYGESSVNNDHLGIVMKDASKIGSVMLIDNMSKEEIYSILYRKLENRIKSSLV